MNVYLVEAHVKFLKILNDLNLSEHIRRAVGEYVDKLKNNRVSASRSKKGSDING